MPAEERYSLLPTDDVELKATTYSDGDDADGALVLERYADSTVKPNKPVSPWIFSCAIASILLLLLNLSLAHLFPSTNSADTTLWMSRSERLAQASALLRPNIYIGLERVDPDIAPTALPETLHIFPHVFAPVSRLEPERVFPSDGRARVTFNGLVSPGEPRVIINKDISMIAQVRVQDHGLERCSIASIIPDPFTLGQNRTLLLSREEINIEVWSLDSSGGELDLTTLSWRTRPTRSALLSRLLVQQNRHTHSAEFDCGPSGSLRTFELACAEGSGDECTIEFWQEQPETKPRMAFTIVQKPSL